MSGICGIVNFDGALVDEALLKRMAEAAVHRGPDGIRYLMEGGIGFAYLALNVTPESLREEQPLRSRDGQVVMAADARVDNRRELIRTLRSEGCLSAEEPTDADIIMAAYECWGEGCAERIIGDFAFAVWDVRRRRLMAARDRSGCRAFYYRRDGNRFLWATEAAQLLADPAAFRRLVRLEASLNRDPAMLGRCSHLQFVARRPD